MPEVRPITAEEREAPRHVSDMQRSLRRRRFICTYFNQLDMEYESLCPVDYQEETASAVRALRADHAKRPSWAINHRFEYLVMGGVHEEILTQRIAIYRERLKTLLSPDGAGLVDKVFAVPTADVQSRRAAALGMLAEIQRLRHVRSEFERLRNRLLLCLLGAGLFFGLLTLTLMIQKWLPPLAHVLAAGLLGGYFSVLLKLGSLRFCLEYNSNYHQVDRLFWNILCNLLLSMFEGAAAALILFSVFLSGMLRGSLFPEFPDVTLEGVDLSKLWWMVPTHSVEASKLVAWSVIAGFSERLIPDLLTTLTRRAADASQPGNAAAARSGATLPSTAVQPNA